MVKGKCKNLTNKNQDPTPSSECSTPTLPSPGHPNTPKKLDQDLKAYLMMMVEDIKKDFNNSLKDIQKNTAKQVEDLKVEAQKSLKELQENRTKQMMELNKTIQDLKREVDTIKRTQSEATLEIENLGKKSGTIDTFSVQGHLGSCQLLAIINKAAMNIVEHVSFLPVGTSSGYMPGIYPVVLCPVF
jgi:ABC-type ATPase with predicted acetyltransferase domain